MPGVLVGIKCQGSHGGGRNAPPWSANRLEDFQYGEEAKKWGGGVRRVVVMCQPRFAPLVKAGTKPHTIRLKRKLYPVQVGDLLSLREWSGVPYRSKQILLREEVCTAVKPVKITFRFGHVLFCVGKNNPLYTEQANALAVADGFRDVDEMLEWFEATHGLPFRGVLIEWKPGP